MENQKTITFPLIVAVRNKAGWIRKVQYNNPIPVMEMPMDAGVITHMLKRYVDKDGDLKDWELMHFLNWAWSFNELPHAAKKGAEVEVLIKMAN